MTKLVSLAAVLGRINPSAWDFIIPHGPILSRANAAISFGATLAGPHAHAAELNPQPLPPKDELVLASVAVSRDIAFAALSAEAAGSHGAAKIVTSAVDEWCGNGRPRGPIPWPGPWPFPWALDSDPRREWDVAAARVVGALTLAAIAGRLQEGAVRDAMAGGAERLLDVALG